MDAEEREQRPQRVRTQVYIEREIWRTLRHLALREGERRGRYVSAADLVNEALAEWLSRRVEQP